VRNDIGPSRKSGYEKKRTNPSGLGRASQSPLSHLSYRVDCTDHSCTRVVVNRRAKAAQIAADPTLHTSEITAGLSSVTQENDLNEFLSTAQLADTDFSAERQNIKVVSDPSLSAASHNPYLLTPQEEQEIRKKQKDNAQRLQVPRRPAWTRDMSRVNLERQERDAFLEWRRGLAESVVSSPPLPLSSQWC
jgi:large subunit GTPase 1